MNHAALKLFIDVSELGSLTKAASAYGTTQPHISRQISDLERACGGRLFQRTGRGVVLTELGEQITPRVRSWLADTDQLLNDITKASGTPVGTVRIGVLPSTAHPLVSTLYYRLKDSFPLVRLVVREGQGSQLESWLDTGLVDLALVFRHGPQPREGETWLIKTDTYLVSRAGDPLTAGPTVPFAALDHLPLVQFCRPNSWRDQLDGLGRLHGIAINTAMEADSLTLQTEIVSRGDCYAVLGPYAIADGLRTGRLQAARLVEPDMTRYIAMALSRHAPLTLACRTVRQMIQDIVHDLNAETADTASHAAPVVFK
ncbi:MAG: LysR family transcription regulator protein [Polaromonas sp.]|nr:LysR family transcription regulator protein [Polaromonas sp.]